MAHTKPTATLENEVPAPDGEAPSHEHGASEHEAHSHGESHRRHKSGHGGGHGGGGHGGGWLMTYCDMITLLMTFFICLLTFSANETGKNGMPRKRDSVVYGKGGTGVLIDRKQGSDKDSIIWRQLPAVYQLSAPGSELPPMYSDPALESTAAVLKLLLDAAPGTLADSYELRVAAAWFLEPEAKLSGTGKSILFGMAGHLRSLPYEVRIETDEPANLDRALAIANEMVKDGMAPSRLGVGIRAGTPATAGNLWIVLKRKS